MVQGRVAEWFGAYDKPCEALVTALVVSASRPRDALVGRLELQLVEKAA
jgi:hypothetical protein